MKPRYGAVLVLASWHLIFPISLNAQDHVDPENFGIRGIIGCEGTFGNFPVGSVPCGRIVDSKTGKDMGQIECAIADRSFFKRLPEGTYTILWRDETTKENESTVVIVEKYKWTDVTLGHSNCPPGPPGPVQ